MPRSSARTLTINRAEPCKEKLMKRLYLSKEKKMFGVCGGIADYYDIDPALVRVGWIVLTLVTGIVPGIIAYILAAIVVPPAPE